MNPEGKTKASQRALACASEATRKLNPHLFASGSPKLSKNCPHCGVVHITEQQIGNGYGKQSGMQEPMICPSCNGLLDEPPKPKTRIRQDKPMNRLEQEAFEYLKEQSFYALRAQSKRFRLASGLWYKPDATGFSGTREVAWEVKGPHAFRGGFENLKMAATQYPEIRWILMWKEDGQWQFQEVLP